MKTTDLKELKKSLRDAVADLKKATNRVAACYRDVSMASRKGVSCCPDWPGCDCHEDEVKKTCPALQDRPDINGGE